MGRLIRHCPRWSVTCGNPGDFFSLVPTRITESFVPALFLYHLQIVRDRENSRHAVGSNIGDILVTFIVYHAFERNLSVLG